MNFNDTSGQSVSKEIKDPGRRNFLTSAIYTFSTLLVGLVAYPMAKFLKQPLGSSGSVNSVLAAKTSDVKKNFWKIFRFGDAPAILINTPKGELKSFTAVCTHLACTVQYMPDKKHIFCACHNGVYDLNGQVVSGPPPRPLEEYRVGIVNEDIIVSKV